MWWANIVLNVLFLSAENLVMAIVMTALLMTITACLIYGTVRVSGLPMFFSVLHKFVLKQNEMITCWSKHL